MGPAACLFCGEGGEEELTGGSGAVELSDRFSGVIFRGSSVVWESSKREDVLGLPKVGRWAGAANDFGWAALISLR